MGSPRFAKVFKSSWETFYPLFYLHPPPPPSQALVQKNMLFCVFFVYLCRRGGNPVSSLIEPTFALESRHKNDSTLSAEW